MSMLVPPHGGKLLPLILTGEAHAEALARAPGLRQIRISSRESSIL